MISEEDITVMQELSMGGGEFAYIWEKIFKIFPDNPKVLDGKFYSNYSPKFDTD